MKKLVVGIAMVILVLILSVGVLTASATSPLKWSQPAYQIGKDITGLPIYWGWDQMSWTFGNPQQGGPLNGPQAADDWMCTDQLPVTDFHWWGSYVGSLNPNPPITPIGFWFGIYSDIPVQPGLNYSMPGHLLWEYSTTNYQETFVGYDTRINDPTVPAVLDDATFQYNVYLPQSNWYYQPGNKTIYWLSIVAIYQPGGAIQEWGWKSRPHFFQDDAVYANSNIGWSPLIGPDGNSWDLSFEISTVPEPGSFLALGTGLVGLAGFVIRRRK